MYTLDSNCWKGTRILTECRQEIHREFQRLRQAVQPWRLGEPCAVEQPMSPWYQWVLWHRDHWEPQVQDLAPVTVSLRDRLQIEENLMFSLLAPAQSIRPHRGWSDHYWRVQLVLETQPGAGVWIEGQYQPEQPGTVTIFRDHALHWAANPGPGERVVLIMDIVDEAMDLEKRSRKESFSPEIAHTRKVF